MSPHSTKHLVSAYRTVVRYLGWDGNLPGGEDVLRPKGLGV